MKLPITAALAAGAYLGAGAVLAFNLWSPACNAASPEPAAQPAGEQAPLDYNPAISLAPLVERVGPAVVNLHVAQTVQFDASDVPGWMFPFMDEDHPKSQIRQGQGSGFLISPDGYILTNNHVVADADTVTVNLGDDLELEAKVIGTDDRTDVALVKVDTKEALPWVQLGSSGGVRVGDRVVAIGNPFGLSHTVTEGIVSAKGRVLYAGPYDDFIQTDASINPGNSGGPLFDLAGRVVGINTAINRWGQGIGFAVPIDQVTPIIDELKAHGKVARGWIGVGLQNLDTDLSKALGAGVAKGVVLREVYPDTPAQRAGLKTGDVLVQLDGKPVGDSDALVRVIGSHRPGEKVALDVIRDGKHKTITVALGERPPEESLQSGKLSTEPPETPSAPELTALGIRVLEGGAVGAEDIKGVVVTEVEDGSPADGRLRPGDVLVQVNHADVAHTEDLEKALKKNPDAALFVVRRGESQVLVVVPLKAAKGK